MDLETRLEDEILFGMGTGKLKIHYLKENGINTIKEFLSCDIDNTGSNEKSREYYRGMKDLLSNKYLDTPLVRDSLLDEEIIITDEIHNTVEEINNKYLNKLCIKTPIGGPVRDLLLIDKIERIKVIDFIRYLTRVKTGEELNILNYYIDYYDNKIYLDAASQEILDNIKKQLINQNKNLDEKIQIINEQVFELEKGKSHGR